MSQKTYTKEECNLALDKAKIALMTLPDTVFFSTICFSLQHVFTEDIPRACTNGLKVKYNPNYFFSLCSEERVSLMVHETMHCAYLHMARLNERDPKKWNIACDHVINLQLIDRNFSVPSTWYADKKYKDKSADQIYDLLPESSNEDMMEDLIESEDISEEELKEKIDEIILNAAIQSRALDKPGVIPGDIEIYLDKLLNPKLPWNRILSKYLQNFTKGDYTFKKPNRRYLPEFILPSLYSKAIINLTIAIDTSGSVSDSDFLRFISESYSMLLRLKPKEVKLIQFDTKIKQVDTIKKAQDLMKVKFYGRGGTNVSPVINYINENNTGLLVIFTDGDFYPPDETTKVDTIWMIHNNKSFEAPLGKTIYYEV